MSTETVSAVIPAHCGAEFVGAALDSVLAQTWPPQEIIVVDDGSQDDLDGALAPFLGHLIVLRQPARGASAARNRGIAVAQGEWIAFLDEDDEWLPTRIERQLAGVAGRPEVALVYSDVEIFGDECCPGRLQGQPTPRGRVFREFLRLGCFVTPSAALARRAAILEVGGFDETLASSEDYDLWLRLAARHEIEFVPGSLARYRVHAGNISKNLKKGLVNRHRVLLKARDSAPDEYGSVWPQVRRRLSEISFESGRLHLHDGELRAARRWFLRCLRYPERRTRALTYLGATLLPRTARAGLRRAKRAFTRLR